MSEYYLFDFQGNFHAIRKAPGIEIKKAEKIHSLPFLKENGKIFFSSVNDKFVYLYDLPHIFGFKDFDMNLTAYEIIISADDSSTGFVFNSEKMPETIDSEEIDLPAHIAYDFTDSIIMHGNKIAPVVKVESMINSIINSGSDIPEFDINGIFFSGMPEVTASSYEVCTCGVFRFCVNKQNNTIDEFNPDYLSRLYYLSDPVIGIYFSNNEIFPVIDLHRVFKMDPSGKNEIIISQNNSLKAGFLTDQSPDKNLKGKIHDLPHLVSKEWMNTAVCFDGGIYPNIDTLSMLSCLKNADRKSNSDSLYHPVSGFPSVFMNEDTSIIEIEISGMTFGIPKEETGNFFEMTDITSIPLMPFIVSGISLYDDEILPVIDLSVFISSKNERKNQSCQLLINNGNFKALLMTDGKPVEKKIPVSSQKKLPIGLKHRFVYGCYIDDASSIHSPVKLILDVHVISRFAEISERSELMLFFERYKKSNAFMEEAGASVTVQNTETVSVVEKTENFEVKVNEDGSDFFETDEFMNFEYNTSGNAEVNIPTTPKTDDKTETDEIINDEVNVNVSISEDIVYSDKPGDIPVNFYENPDPVIRKDKALEDEKPDEIIDEDKLEEIKSEETGQKAEMPHIQVEQTEKENVQKPLISENKILIFLLILIISSLIFLFTFHNLAGIRTGISVKTAETFSSEEENISEFGKNVIEHVKNDHTQKPVSDTEKNSLKFENILFLPDSAELKQSEIKKLKKVTGDITALAGRRFYIILTGHTAYFGTEEGRKTLSGKRAESVYDFIANELKLEKSRFKIKGMGSDNQIGDSSTVEGNMLNRRVEISIEFY